MLSIFENANLTIKGANADFQTGITGRPRGNASFLTADYGDSAFNLRGQSPPHSTGRHHTARKRFGPERMAWRMPGVS